MLQPLDAEYHQVKISSSPQHFITHLFARDVHAFEAQRSTPLTALSQRSYLQRPASPALRRAERVARGRWGRIVRSWTT